ncbi:MAG TPA: hypothetical protein VF469_18470 [Kofleriaceae bacterium]
MSRHTVTHASDYLVREVDLPGEPGFHQISLTWNRQHPEAQGSAYLDPNSCGLDEFGDPAFCTLIALAPRDVELSLFGQKPGYDAYSVKWRVSGSGAPYEAVPLRLVTIRTQGQPLRVRLLVLNPRDQSITRIIALHEQQPA